MIFDVDSPNEVARWRPLVHWLLALPHLLLVSLLQYAAGFVAFLSFFAVLFTKVVPESLYNFQVMVLRYNARVSTYAAFMYEPYPPFMLEVVASDPGESPVTLTMPPPQEMNRWLVFVKWLLLVPHFVVLSLLGIGAFFALIGSALSVIFTGRYPEGIKTFLVGFGRWSTRVTAYLYFLTDDYPPFSLE